MDEAKKREKMERARAERELRERAARSEVEERRKKITDVFEKLVKFRHKEVDADDDEIVHYEYVDIYQSFCKDGPRPGQKFKYVDLNADTGDLVFKLKTGDRLMCLVSATKPIVYVGTFSPPKDLEEEDLDENGDFIIPKGRQARV